MIFVFSCFFLLLFVVRFIHTVTNCGVNKHNSDYKTTKKKKRRTTSTERTQTDTQKLLNSFRISSRRRNRMEKTATKNVKFRRNACDPIGTYEATEILLLVVSAALMVCVLLLSRSWHTQCLSHSPRRRLRLCVIMLCAYNIVVGIFRRPRASS